MELLKTEMISIDGVTTLVVSGEVDFSVREEFAEALQRAAAAADVFLLVDLGDVDFIDSSGIHCLIDVCKRCYARNVGFRVCRVSGRAGRVFEIAGVHDTLCGPSWMRDDYPTSATRALKSF